MKQLARRFATLVTSVSVSAAFIPLLPARADLEFGGFDAGAVLRTPPPQTGELLALDMNRIISTQTRFIRYEATEYQRKVAESRARAFVAAQRRAAAKAKPIAKSTETPKKSTKAKPGEPKVATKPTEPAKPQAVAEPKPLPRYIAVDTVKDKRASPKAEKVVMIWDTQSETLVGNNLYDVENPPKVGASARFETYSAQYIGAGL